MAYKVYTKEFDQQKHLSEIAADFETASPQDAEIARRFMNMMQGGSGLPAGVGQEPVTLLLDLSGSMRGVGNVSVCLAASEVARLLEERGTPVEILGFTTASWKGGEARQQWITDGRPQQPGRLNDLLHVTIKDRDETWAQASQSFFGLLKPGLLKENIDGEALLWANQRMRERGEAGRIILVSDGAPIDDSTLSVNPQSFLKDHLREVVNGLVAQGTSISAVELVSRHWRPDHSIWEGHATAQLVEMRGEVAHEAVVGTANALLGGIFKALQEPFGNNPLRGAQQNITPSSLEFDVMKKPEDLQTWLVRTLESGEDSTWPVRAATAEAAAGTYLEASLKEGTLSSFSDEIGQPHARIEVTLLNLDGRGAGVIAWEDVEQHSFAVTDLMPDYAARAEAGDDDPQP